MPYISFNMKHEKVLLHKILRRKITQRETTKNVDSLCYVIIRSWMSYSAFNYCAFRFKSDPSFLHCKNKNTVNCNYFSCIYKNAKKVTLEEWISVDFAFKMQCHIVKNTLLHSEIKLQVWNAILWTVDSLYFDLARDQEESSRWEKGKLPSVSIKRPKH